MRPDGETHRLNANEFVGDQGAEYSAYKWECNSCKPLNIATLPW